MYRNFKCVLITVVICLLLVVISQLGGRESDGPSNISQPVYRINSREHDDDETFQKSQPNSGIQNTEQNSQTTFQKPLLDNKIKNLEQINREKFQKSQLDRSQNIRGQSSHQSLQKLQPDSKKDSREQNTHQIIQQTRPELPREPVSTQVHHMGVPVKNPFPSSDVLESMSHKDVQAFYHSYVNSPQVPCSRVERMGKLSDGGWELCDDPVYRPLKGDCLVYSYGINFDYSYDDDMVTYGCEVHAFDPSMNIGPQLRGERVFFHPYGVGAKNESILSPKYDRWQLYTIGEHRKMLGHTPDERRLDIVKMDVEGHELDSLMTALDDGSLVDVRQLAFETHVGWSKSDPTKEEYLKFLALFRKVYDHGFRIYATHRNYQWSAFESLLIKGKTRAHCHEVHTININVRNTVRDDGKVEGDGEIKDAIRQARYSLQLELLDREKLWYRQFQAPKQRITKGV